MTVGNGIGESASANRPILEVKGLKKYFPVKSSFGRTTAVVKAVNDVSFNLYKGETFGLVGESGCGKSTLGRTVLRLIEPTAGEANLHNRNLFALSARELRQARQKLQMVFQDPYSSLNPRKRIGSILEEALVIHNIGSRKERTERVLDILGKVGLLPDHYYRYPHECSGGQRQRIGLARALILQPDIMICDEPVSALDVSIQSQILNLMKELQDEFKLSYLFIAHDISVVRHISDRIGVMYLGQLVEEAPTDSLIGTPHHPYTQALLSAVPIPSPSAKRTRVKLTGEIPSPLHPPSGCIFHTRCPFATDMCKQVAPIKKQVSPDHFAACHLYP